MNCQSVEEVLSNEFFLAWYFRRDAEKAQQWEHWLLDNPHCVPVVEESISWLKEQYRDEEGPAVVETDAAWQRLNQTLEMTPVVALKPRRQRWWIAAAALLLLALGGYAFWNYASQTRFHAGYGQTAEYRLPDGSQVQLNAHSEIRLDGSWESGDREVWVKGEAFFHVAKTPDRRKFIVHATGMDVIVTGTQFNVVSRSDESSVLLTEGSVTLRTADGKEIRMKPGDFVRLENEHPALQTVDQERVLAWKQSKLDFENTPMNEVAKVISRHYGVKVTLSDKATEEKRISGVMPNDNLDVLIRALEALDFTITRKPDEIVITAS